MKDAFGNKLAVGDIVVYGEQTYGPRYLKKGRVLKLTPKGAKVGDLARESAPIPGEQVLTPNMMLVEAESEDSKLWLEPN